MATDQMESWDRAKVEYESALEQTRSNASLRRQDMIFVTTVQAAVLTIVGKKLLCLDCAGWLLSIIAFAVLLLGLNSERRLAAYIAGYMHRANQIESENGMSLLSSGRDEVRKRKSFSNSVVFQLYYFIFILVWVVIWVMNGLS